MCGAAILWRDLREVCAQKHPVVHLLDLGVEQDRLALPVQRPQCAVATPSNSIADVVAFAVLVAVSNAFPEIFVSGEHTFSEAGCGTEQDPCGSLDLALKQVRACHCQTTLCTHTVSLSLQYNRFGMTFTLLAETQHTVCIVLILSC